MGHYLVTGVAGFIASKVAELLTSAGHTVIGVDNLSDAYDVRLKEWRLARLQELPGFEFHRLDITERQHLQTLWETQDERQFEAVINLAAQAGVRRSLKDPRLYFETNVTGTLNLLELCRSVGVGKFVLASTSSLYGVHNPRPFREDADTDTPLSPYAASKKAAEVLSYAYHHLYSLDVTVLRYFTVYGPAGRPDMAPFRFVQWIHEGRPVTVYGDGQQSRDFTYVDDIAQGTLAALQPVGYEVINLGSNQPVLLREFIQLVERLVGRPAHLAYRPRHPADMPATWADIGKAERVLGWRPHVGLEEGMQRLVDWYAANREWAKEVATG